MMGAFSHNYDGFLLKLQNFCFLIVVVVATNLLTDKSFAVSLSAGLSAVDEQDSRSRPAASIFVEGAGDWEGSAAVYGQDFAKVEQRSLLIAGYKKTSLFNSKYLSAGIGVAGLVDSTKFADNPEDNATSYNIGASALVRMETNPKSKITAGLSWQSHIFPAGRATFYLVTARRQVITLSAGVRL
ncbi:MAG: hypothetical protein AB7T49_06395 [Oligoflexales bacterium]